jgi:glycosyl transferase family 25
MNHDLPPIFVINLTEDEERRDTMRTRLNSTGVNYAFFEAINGRGFDMTLHPLYDRAKRRACFGRDMIPGELGCLLSHRAIFEKMDRENIHAAVILEDDVIFEPEFKEVLMALMKCPIAWDVIRFVGSEKIYKRGCRKIVPLVGKYWMARLPTTPGGAHGYLLTLKAARVMLRHMQKNWMPIDTLQGRSWETGLETLVVYPAPLHIDQSALTTIGDARFDKTVTLEGWRKTIFPLTRGWFKLNETVGKKWIYWSSWPKDRAAIRSYNGKV